MKYLILLLLFSLFSAHSFSQKRKNSKTTFEIPDTSNVKYPDGKYNYPINGKQYVTGFYKNNVKVGEWRIYGDSGILRVHGNYIDGKKNGEWNYFSPEGKITATYLFKNDSVIGNVLVFDLDGNKTEKEFEQNNDSIRTICEILPHDPGGQNSMMTFLWKNLRYPTNARENNIQGRVVLQFVVDVDGTIKNIKIIQDPGGYCGLEAIRVIKNMPPWIPAFKDGLPIPFYFKLPIIFKLGTE